MGRRPKPWYKATHKAWFTKLDGRVIRLGDTKKEADREFHRLMAERGAGGQIAESRLTLEAIADLWYDDVKGRLKPKTLERYGEYAQSLIDFAGKVPCKDLKPYHVTRWLKANPGWKSKSTQHLAVSVAKIITSWGVAQGYISSDPWDKVKRPTMQRREPIAEEDVLRLIEGIQSPEFREFLTLAIETGCRPGELRNMQAQRIDWKEKKVIVTGKVGDRVVYLSDRALDILRRLAVEYPTGPVMRNTRGQPWGDKAIRSQFERAGRRVGVKVVPYHIRGLFASLAIRRGVDTLLVAKMLGHVDLTMLNRHYASVASDQMRDAVTRATSPPSVPTIPPPESGGASSKTPEPKSLGKTRRKRRDPSP